MNIIVVCTFIIHQIREGINSVSFSTEYKYSVKTYCRWRIVCKCERRDLNAAPDYIIDLRKLSLNLSWFWEILCSPSGLLVSSLLPEQGALVGALISLNLVAWISFGSQAAISNGSIYFPVKPVSVEGCSESLKSTIGNLTMIVETAVRYIRIFFAYK